MIELEDLRINGLFDSPVFGCAFWHSSLSLAYVVINNCSGSANVLHLHIFAFYEISSLALTWIEVREVDRPEVLLNLYKFKTTENNSTANIAVLEKTY